MYADLLKEDSEKKTIHEISGYFLCVKSSYEEDQIYHHRGDDARKVFIALIQSLGKELSKKLKCKCRYDIWEKRKRNI